MESIRLVRQDLRLAALLAVVASVSFALDPVTTLAPAFATRVFHRSDTLAGFLIGAFGAGAVIAAIFATGPSATPYRRIAVMLTALSAGIFAYALLPVLPLAFFALAVGGFGYLAGQTRATTLVQLGVPDNQRGRIMALWSVCFLGARPIASLIDGSLASIIGIHATAVVMTIPTMITGAMMATIYRRQSRQEADAQRVEREVAHGSSASHD
jgi:MFS family permease